MNDLYEVLQVRRGAEPEVIRAAYRALARKHHPDFGGSPERMAAINEAWAILGDQARRAAYDAQPQRPSPRARTRPATTTPARPRTSRRRPPPAAASPAGARRSSAARGP